MMSSRDRHHVALFRGRDARFHTSASSKKASGVEAAAWIPWLISASSLRLRDGTNAPYDPPEQAGV